MDYRRMLEDQHIPLAELLGIRFVAAEPEHVRAEMIVRAEICTVPAILHGGAIMAFADTLGACATMINLPKGAGTTTLESKTNFLAGVPLGSKVIGECTPIHRGKSTMVWQTKVILESGKLCAIVTQTQMVLQPRG
jgi:1,4-dihydroxy-2-naphthoyl-CoA hydrolase